MCPRLDSGMRAAVVQKLTSMVPSAAAAYHSGEAFSNPVSITRSRRPAPGEAVGETIPSVPASTRQKRTKPRRTSASGPLTRGEERKEPLQLVSVRPLAPFEI